jgi:hypothetical protein
MIDLARRRAYGRRERGTVRGMESQVRPQAPQSHNGHPPAGSDPSNYAALNLIWGTGLAALLITMHGRAAEREPIPYPELIPVGAATFALAKVVAKEKVGSWVREPFVEQDENHKPVAPRGRGFRYAVGELMTCTRCVGAWSALGLVGLRIASPPAGRIVTSVLATSAVNDFLQAAFRYSSEKADRAGQPAG